MKKLTEDEKRVRKELTKVFPQLQINCQKVCGAGYHKWGDDLLQLSVEMFLEKPIEDQIFTIEQNKLENFITYIMNFQLKRGQTTRFWHTHRKFLGTTRELYNGTYDYKHDEMFPKPFDEEISDLQMCIDKQVEDLNPFQKMLIQEKVYYGNSFVDISKKYDIPYTSLQQGLKRTLRNIKELCKHLT